ncbi:SDR family NAD(P)-dependent oxidoreductase [Rasiella sp. SM2506]|uniref:SDR family NAD(P)-dependent oxidoreductase n=1 Tax=Rasiella sp. SM2506 TaxID=3423914 RepID=UPI003D795A82
MTKIETTPKTALILGGSSGLGLATAHKLASAGYAIVLVHRDRKSNIPNLEAEVAKMESFGVSVTTYNKDALKEETMQEVLAEIEAKSISVLIHSIAKGSLKALSGTEEVLSKIDIDITLHAMGTSWWQWTAALLQQDKFCKNVRNIAFTSEGNTKVWPGYGAVSAAKATLEALMRQMAIELAPHGITTNCIQAGTTETPSFKMIPGSDKLAEMAKRRNPFGRLTTPEDVANAVWLLCQEEGKWINGVVLRVDGGEGLR